MLNTRDEIGDIYKELKTFHEKTGTSLYIMLRVSDQSITFVVHIATVQDQNFEFSDASSVLAWLRDINDDIDPTRSSISRKKAEALAARQILLDAEKQVVAREMSELGETQAIIQATAEADRLLQESSDKLRLLTLAKGSDEERAAAKQKLAEERFAKADKKELRKLIDEMNSLREAAQARILELGA